MLNRLKQFSLLKSHYLVDKYDEMKNDQFDSDRQDPHKGNLIIAYTILLTNDMFRMSLQTRLFLCRNENK